MRKVLLALALALLSSTAQAQTVQCSDRPAGDNTNACANTRFVMSNAGFWMADAGVAVNNSASYPIVRITRSNTGNQGATLQLGHDAYMWTLIGNQIAGGDLIFRNPAGGNVIVMPEVGGCVGIQASLASCPAGIMLDVGPASGLAGIRMNGSTFIGGLGPQAVFAVAGSVAGRVGTDCAILTTPCNNDLVFRGPNTSRHFQFYEWAGIHITNTPTATPTHYVGGSLTVHTDSRNTFVGGNAITGQSDINTGGNFPTVITALANVIDTTTGGPGAAVWGIYSHCDVKGLAECAAVEGTASNRNAAPGVPPIASVPGAPQPFPVALKATCGGQISPSLPGLFGCSVGVWIHYYEGNGGWPFLYGIYMTEGIASTTGILVNASATLTPATSAEFRQSGAGKGVVIRNMGVPTANLALEIQNSAGATISSIQWNGVVNFTNGGSVIALSTFSLLEASGFTLQLTAASAPVLTANRVLTFDVNNANRRIDMAGDLAISNNFTTDGNFALTLTQTGVTNVTLPTSGLLATTSNNLGDFAATTSAQLAGVISDETGTGTLVFSTSPVFVSGITVPIIHGGSAANSTLFLRSTAGAGTSDAILFQTGSQVEAGRITTGQQWQIGSNFAPASGVKVQISANAAALSAPIVGSIIHIGNVDGASTRITMDAFGTGFFPSTVYRQARGTSAAKTATQSADLLGSFFAFGYGATGYLSNSGAGLVMVAQDNFTDTAGGSRAELWATQNATTSASAVARFDRPTTAGQTALTIFDVDNAILERVTVGAADSGGVGFKLLRIAN